MTAWRTDVTLLPRAGHTLAAAGRLAVELLLPAVCAACEQRLDAGDAGPVCARCWIRARALPYPQCVRCGHPLRPSGQCPWCVLWPPYVRAIRSAYWIPGGTAGQIVYALKYHGWTRTAHAMAERMARCAWPTDVMEERTALVPVPLSATRARERGFNQSALLAAALASRWQLPVWSTVLERTRATRTQTRLTPDARRANVAGAFRAVETAGAALAGSHPVLVDDVVTTGATLVACAAALHAAGARIISVITFGRAPATGDRP
ncbi:MAG TPA: phosphoribosyltransferase family protein [Gemmatimonadaceae bacterium]|nr:phosphoribosyltransferase family protein [Gemmatimonadaceae bacterium]